MRQGLVRGTSKGDQGLDETGDFALDDQAQPLPLRIGEVVPRFSGRSTLGPLDLDDYRGQWVMLFSHPADFTPVCTSEFLAFARAEQQFTDMNCALIGMSVDSLYSHLAWIRMIFDLTGEKIAFPIVEDPTMEIARAYGMLGHDAQDAGTVRTAYFIDPDGILRACTCYPPTVGRSIPEILRLLAALQRVDRGDVLTPADWQPGDDVLHAPAETLDAALAPGNAFDWFYASTKDTR